MSDEFKKTVLNTLAEPIANSAKNITDKPTQNMGTTFADIWYLVFGGISQAAEKRKLKYSYALQEFEKELKEEINKIPEENKIEADIQVIAPALEASKYCAEKEELRHMFVRLISKSMNWETKKYTHPSFINIIEQLSPYDAKILTNIHKYISNSKLNINLNSDELIFALSSLERQGLIYINIEHQKATITIESDITYFIGTTTTDSTKQIASVSLTKLGEIFCNICLSDKDNI